MAAMNNQQLTEAVERLMNQNVELAVKLDDSDRAHAATAQALAELTSATDTMSQGLDNRIIQCENSVEMLKQVLLQTQEEIKNLQKQSERSGDGRIFRLLDPKTVKPGKFNGNRKMWKSWSRAMKAFLNSQYPGFRKVLEWAEKMPTRPTKDEIAGLQWKYADDA